MLFINLGLQRRLDLGHFFRAAEFVFDPADDDLGGEVGVGNHRLGVGLLQADGAVGAGFVGAVVGVHGVVYRHHGTVGRMPFHLSNLPLEGCGAHRTILTLQYNNRVPRGVDAPEE